MKHKPVKISEYYKKEKRFCDRCGEGTFMAEHKDRWYCGKCKLTIWKKKD
ncbi:MAG: 30S ribosomal protein S27ae [Candidatus Aenigmatarchaeota archaeon]